VHARLFAKELLDLRPDGYTLLMAGGYNAINATLYDKLNFNFIRDITAVAGIARVPSVMVVHPSVPATTVPEFIAYAKSKPGKITMASGGVGTPSHLEGELFKTMTVVDMLHVPYRGVAPALTDLLGGQVEVMVTSSVPKRHRAMRLLERRYRLSGRSQAGSSAHSTT
jgi:tripartite-type tricarboxylate transporter receptor subunit TctC